MVTTIGKSLKNIINAHNSQNLLVSVSMDKITSIDQNLVLFNKRKYGLFKTENIVNKYIKHKIMNTFFNFKKEQLDTFGKKSNFKKHKFIFYKKLNKGYYRLGRKLLLSQLKLKNYTIQKYTNKKLYALVKKPFLNKLQTSRVQDIISQCNLFYSITDITAFIKLAGIMINSSFINDPNKLVSINTIFSIPTSSSSVKFFKKTKTKTIISIKKSKFYKYRAKHYVSKKTFNWINTKEWLKLHSVLYINRINHIQFDLKSLSGVVLFSFNINTHNLAYNYLNTSLYMHRSYMWKHIV